MGEDDGFDDADDPARAFARVEDRLASVHGEVALLRAAIEGLTAARELGERLVDFLLQQVVHLAGRGLGSQHGGQARG